MTQQTLYPVFIGLLDIGFAGLLFIVAPILGVMMGAVGLLVVGTYIFQQLDHPTTVLSFRMTGDV